MSSARLFLCLKRQGAGREFASTLASASEIEALDECESQPFEAEAEDEVLDVSLSPAQIRDLEDKRAAVCIPSRSYRPPTFKLI